jgi:hypothetical protein
VNTTKSYCLTLLLTLAVATVLSAQEKEGAREPWFRFGPRIGVTGVVSMWDDFDDNIQQIEPADRDYFPVYSAVGFALEQAIRLSPGSSFVLRELWLRSGYDQSVVFPSIIVTAGLRIRDRLDVFVGPEWTTDFAGGRTDEMAYLAVGFGYIFRPWGARMPVTVTAVPLTEDWKPRVTLMMGLDFHLPRFDFGLWKAEEEEDLPFSY